MMNKPGALQCVTTWIVASLALLLSLGGANLLCAKEKNSAVDPNDPTLRLFQLLDGTYAGKLEDTYILADIYPDPKNSSQEFQRVLRVEYDKNRAFGKLKIYVRSVAKMQPEQLKTYTPKIVFDFGEVDSEKFVKTDPGLFGKPGDLHLRATEERPLATAPITEDARKSYERLVTDYILPALKQKK